MDPERVQDVVDGAMVMLDQDERSPSTPQQQRTRQKQSPHHRGAKAAGATRAGMASESNPYHQYPTDNNNSKTKIVHTNVLIGE
jgi:hypothetical protein